MKNGCAVDSTGIFSIVFGMSLGDFASVVTVAALFLAVWQVRQTRVAANAQAVSALYRDVELKFQALNDISKTPLNKRDEKYSLSFRVHVQDIINYLELASAKLLDDGNAGRSGKCLLSLVLNVLIDIERADIRLSEFATGPRSFENIRAVLQKYKTLKANLEVERYFVSRVSD